jgi:hypothetical protein
MGKTVRASPSSGVYMKRQKHVNRRKVEESAEDSLSEYPSKKHNRISSAHSRIADPWDDKTITEYRGQDWHRNRK